MGDRSQFTTTRWSVVLAAGKRTTPAGEAALSTLCQTYWYPLYSFARRIGSGPEEARDLTQDFFARMMERETLQQVDPAKGRFRSFLLRCFKNFVADEHRKERAKKRGGGSALLPLEVETAEGRYQREPSHDQTPEKIYERVWALTLLERAVDRLQEEYTGPRKQRLFAKLKVYLPGSQQPVPYAQTAKELGMNEVTIKVTIHRLRQRFRTVLVEEIAHTVGREEDIETEIRHLLAALGG